MLALGPRNLWVMVLSGTPTRRTAAMLHWNGRRWSHVRLPNNGAGFTGTEQGVPIASDGHGSFWFQEHGPKAPSRFSSTTSAMGGSPVSGSYTARR